MQTIGKRLYNLRREKKLARDALGAKIGVSKTAIKNWEDDENAPKFEYLQLLSNYFGCSIEYLTEGTVSKNDPSSICTENMYYAPVLNFTQAAKFYIDSESIVVDKYIPILGAEYSEHHYWLILENESMQPDFKVGELILINPKLSPSPGDYIVALEKKSKEVVFRKWRSPGIDEGTAKNYSQLVSNNNDFPIIDSRYTLFEVCGIAIEHRIKLR